MNFTVKKHSKEEFYETFCKWLNEHSFPLINDVILPNNVFVCYVDDLPIYCAWVYFTDSRLSWMAFPASNKNINYKKRQGGMEFLLEYIFKYLKKKKIVAIFTTSGTDSIKESLIKTGFSIGDNEVSHYTKKI